MKCRRNKNSSGARLRQAAAHAPAVATPPPPSSSAVDLPERTDGGPLPQLRIDSRATGVIRYDGAVIVEAQGSVNGTISATVIIVEGEVAGDLRATQALRLGASACVVGNLQAPLVAVARGARLQGRVSTRPIPPMEAELDDREADQVLSGRA